MSKRSYNELKELVTATNQNFKRIELPDILKAKVSGDPVPVYSIINIRDGLTNIVIIGTLKECELYLNGMNWLINHKLYQPIIITKPTNTGNNIVKYTGK